MRYNAAACNADVCNFSFLVLSSLDKQWLKQWFSLPLLESPSVMSPIPFLLLLCYSSCRWCFSWAINISSFLSKKSPRCCALEIRFLIVQFSIILLFFLLNFAFVLLLSSLFAGRKIGYFSYKTLSCISRPAHLGSSELAKKHRPFGWVFPADSFLICAWKWHSLLKTIAVG